MANLSRFHPTSADCTSPALVVTYNGVYRTSIMAGESLSTPRSKGRSQRVFDAGIVVKALSQRPVTL